MASQSFYVDPVLGNNGNSGLTKALAWKTIQYAADNADPAGGTPVYVYFRQGAYSVGARVDFDTYSGTDDDNRIYFIGDYNGDIWDDGVGAVSVSLSANAFQVFSVPSEAFITIRGFELVGTAANRPAIALISVDQADSITIEECFFSADNRATGVSFTLGTDNIIRNSIIINDTGTAGLYLGRTSATVVNNTFYNSNTYCILVSNVGIGQTSVTTLYNNIMQKGNTALLRIRSFDADFSNFTLTSNNNQFYRDGATDVVTVIDTGGTTNHTTLASWQGDADFTNQDLSSQESDPLLSNAGGTSKDDYQIAVTSPCIDSGTSTSAPSRDGWGDSRPQGSTYDIGADEILFSAPTAGTISNIYHNRLTLSWTSGGGIETGWKIFRSTDGSHFTYLDQTSSTSYVDEGLDSDTTYYYRVFASVLATGSHVSSSYASASDTTLSITTRTRTAETFNNLRDWNRCTSNNITKADNGFRLTSAGTGWLQTPDIDAGVEIDTWGPLLITFGYGSSATFLLSSSHTGSSWSSWETLRRGKSPILTKPRRFFRIRVELSDTSVRIEEFSLDYTKRAS